MCFFFCLKRKKYSIDKDEQYKINISDHHRRNQFILEKIKPIFHIVCFHLICVEMKDCGGGGYYSEMDWFPSIELGVVVWDNRKQTIEEDALVDRNPYVKSSHYSSKYCPID